MNMPTKNDAPPMKGKASYYFHSTHPHAPFKQHEKEEY